VDRLSELIILVEWLLNFFLLFLLIISVLVHVLFHLEQPQLKLILLLLKHKELVLLIRYYGFFVFGLLLHIYLAIDGLQEVVQLDRVLFAFII
jgi:hypothetical protein